MDLEHVYLDGTKPEANAHNYSRVWKKGSIHSRNNVFSQLNVLLTEMNETVLASYRIKFEVRQEYAIEYVEYIPETYPGVTGIRAEDFVHGQGKRKSQEQKQYEKVDKCLKKERNTVNTSGSAETNETAIPRQTMTQLSFV